MRATQMDAFSRSGSILYKKNLMCCITFKKKPTHVSKFNLWIFIPACVRLKILWDICYHPLKKCLAKYLRQIYIVYYDYLWSSHLKDDLYFLCIILLIKVTRKTHLWIRFELPANNTNYNFCVKSNKISCLKSCLTEFFY